MKGWKLDELKVEFENIPHPKVLRFIVSILLIPIVIGITVWVADGAQPRKLIVPIVGFLIGIIFSSLLVRRFYYWSPRRLTIYDDGIIFHYRNKRETCAGWTDVLILYIGSTEPSGFYGVPKESLIKLKGDFRPKVINLEIALLIKEQMLRRLGPTEATRRIHSW